jgi:hypothetical protein
MHPVGMLPGVLPRGWSGVEESCGIVRVGRCSFGCGHKVPRYCVISSNPDPAFLGDLRNVVSGREMCLNGESEGKQRRLKIGSEGATLRRKQEQQKLAASARINSKAARRETPETIDVSGAE